MPTDRRRHAITETPPVQEALDRLRSELGADRVDLGELVVLGADEKLARLRGDRERPRAARARLAGWIRSGEVPVDPAAADEVRCSWTTG
ncbi:MAG: hypothetical protein ACR2HC_10235 [Thermoleophilaceae bacterium]